MSKENKDKADAAETRSKQTKGFMQQVRVAARRKYTPEEKVRIVLEGFRREVAVNELCRREGIKPGAFYAWTKDFMEAGKERLTRDTVRDATRQEIAGMTEDEFVATIEAKHQGRIMRRKLRALHYSARTSIGVEAGALSVASEISFLIEKLELIRRQIGVMVRTLVRLVDETEEGKYLLSIRGLNYVGVAGLLAELGTFKSYRNAKQMIKMAGSNPTESESAGKKGTHTPMSKKGRPVLRYCAWTAVIPMLRFNPDFRAWAKQRRERPVHANPLNGREVVGAALNRLLRLAFTLVKRQTFYQLPQAQLAEVVI